MVFSSKSVLATAVMLAVSAQQSFAVCSPGQMAVGTEMLQMFTGPASSFNEYSGFLMANNCGLIAQNGLTQAKDQLCKGGYSGGASVSCDSHGNPVAAVDTQGSHWSCFPTNDHSCDVGGSGGRFMVLACCNRN